MMMARRSRSSGASSYSSGGSIVSDDSASASAFKVNDVANLAAIKAARAEVSCLHATHKIETQSLRHEIKHWKALAARKDQVFDKAIGSLKKELEQARRSLTDSHLVRDKLRQRVMNIEERMISENVEVKSEEKVM